jgi:hypothetical protein
VGAAPYTPAVTVCRSPTGTWISRMPGA